MTAPSEQEIREAVQAALDDSSVDIGEWVHTMLAPLLFVPPGERGPAYEVGLWDDLRPSQAERLDNLIEGVYIRIQPLEEEVTTKIREAIVEAALTFAAEYPDAPRGRQEAAAVA